MGEAGRQMLALLDEMRRFHSQLALLLGTCEELMGERGWENAATDSAAWAYGSTSSDRPRGWMPSEIFRFYVNEKLAGVLAFTSVVLQDAEGDFTRPLQEPLMCGGWFTYDAIPKISSSIQWHSRWHCYHEDRRDDASWQEMMTSAMKAEDVKKYQYGFKRVRTFAVPLAQIVDAASLQTGVVNPLIDDIAKTPLQS